MTLGQFWLWGLSGLGLGSLLMLFVALVWSVIKTIREPKPKFNDAMYSPADLKTGPIKLHDRSDPKGYLSLLERNDRTNLAAENALDYLKKTSGETRPGEKGN